MILLKMTYFVQKREERAFVNNARIRFSSTKSLENALFVFDDNKVFINFQKHHFLKIWAQR